MLKFRALLLIAIFVPVGAFSVSAQVTGQLEVTGRVKIGTKVEKIKRKRFYLFRGGLAANKPLIDKLKTVDAVSRDCFYCQMKASTEFIGWLKTEDCESPFCRDISADDTAKVPEFQAAYQKGIRQFRGKQDIARMWLTTNLVPNLRDGFYRQRKTLIDGILGATKPLQSSMTDSVSVRAIFIDIPLQLAGKTTETFLVSNLVPIEIGTKSYLWACEVEIGAAKKGILALKVPENNKPVPRCEVIVKDLPACTAGNCPAK